MKHLLISIFFCIFATITFAQDKTQYISHHDNGKIKEVGYFNEEGVITGQWIEYHENGTKVGQVEWVDGIKHGTWLIWDKDGTLRFEMYYSMGKRVGTWKQFDGDGKITSSKEF